MVFLLGCYSK